MCVNLTLKLDGWSYAPFTSAKHSSDAEYIRGKFLLTTGWGIRVKPSSLQVKLRTTTLMIMGGKKQRIVLLVLVVMPLSLLLSSTPTDCPKWLLISLSARDALSSFISRCFASKLSPASPSITASHIANTLVDLCLLRRIMLGLMIRSTTKSNSWQLAGELLESKGLAKLSKTRRTQMIDDIQAKRRIICRWWWHNHCYCQLLPQNSCSYPS